MRETAFEGRKDRVLTALSGEVFVVLGFNNILQFSSAYFLRKVSLDGVCK